MVHGKILALEIYFLLILLIQYNIILIIINFRYIILLFANKQWGINKAGLENPIPFNISFTKTARVLAIPNVLSTNPLPSCVQFVNDTASVNRAILDVRDIDGKSQNGLYVQWFAIGA